MLIAEKKDALSEKFRLYRRLVNFLVSFAMNLMYGQCRIEIGAAQTRWSGRAMNVVAFRWLVVHEAT